MLSATTIVPITQYDALSDTASTVYEIAVGIQPVQLLNPTLGTSSNCNVIIVKDGLQNTVSALETSATINYKANANTATATGLLLVGSGVAATLAGVATSGTSNITTPVTYVTASGSNVKVTLPTISKLAVYEVFNTSAVTISVFPKTGDFIDALAVNTAVTIPAGESKKFYTKSISAAATSGAGWFSI